MQVVYAWLYTLLTICLSNSDKAYKLWDPERNDLLSILIVLQELALLAVQCKMNIKAVSYDNFLLIAMLFNRLRHLLLSRLFRSLNSSR